MNYGLSGCRPGSLYLSPPSRGPLERALLTTDLDTAAAFNLFWRYHVTFVNRVDRSKMHTGTVLMIVILFYMLSNYLHVLSFKM